VAIFDGNLGFGVGSEPGGFAGFANSAEFSSEAVREHDGGGHEFWGFPAGIPKHKSLVARTLLSSFFSRDTAGIDALGDIGALAGEGVHNVDAIGVKDIIVVGITNFANGRANEFVVVKLGSGCDFARNDNEIGFNEGLARNPTGWVLA
jgi:hypothetical protein